MKITIFKIDEYNQELKVNIQDISSLVSINLFKSTTYGDYNKAINLDNKIRNSNTLSFTIKINDLNESYFDGLYILEVIDQFNTHISTVSKLNRIEECILDEALKLSVCNDCLDSKSDKVVNLYAMLSGLNNALELGFVNEAINIHKALDKSCSNKCKSCGDYKNPTENNESTFVSVDGGEIETQVSSEDDEINVTVNGGII